MSSTTKVSDGERDAITDLAIESVITIVSAMLLFGPSSKVMLSAIVRLSAVDLATPVVMEIASVTVNESDRVLSNRMPATTFAVTETVSDTDIDSTTCRTVLSDNVAVSDIVLVAERVVAGESVVSIVSAISLVKLLPAVTWTSVVTVSLIDLAARYAVVMASETATESEVERDASSVVAALSVTDIESDTGLPNAFSASIASVTESVSEVARLTP